MNSFIHDNLAGLLDAHEPPCLSLYQPTHRHHPDNQQDPIRFRNLVKAMEESLRQRYPTREVHPLLEPFQGLAEDHDFWNHTLDGLAVLGAPGMFGVYRLQRPVAELALVADTFHVKPLLRILQSADRYQVLGLSRGEIKLFEGNRDTLDEIALAQGVPRTITEALGEELTEPHLTVASYGMGADGPAMHHGHGARKEEIDRDAERFFRAVDRAILEHHSRPSGLPLLLAALPEHHHLFRQVSHNPFLMAEAIDIHPDALPIDALRDRAWRAVEPQYLARLAGLVEAFGEARSKGLGTDVLAQVAEAVIAGRVATLLIEADRQVPGRMDAATGRITFDNMAHPEVDDLLDDLGELALKMGGQIVVVPAERMPTSTGIAAIYRF
jgi:Bacterial archaeo-eukaryotic release factor family 3